jgi:hypothetical protein
MDNPEYLALAKALNNDLETELASKQQSGEAKAAGRTRRSGQSPRDGG